MTRERLTDEQVKEIDEFELVSITLTGADIADRVRELYDREPTLDDCKAFKTAYCNFDYPGVGDMLMDLRDYFLEKALGTSPCGGGDDD